MTFTYRVPAKHGDLFCVLVYCDGHLLGQLLMNPLEWAEYQRQHFVRAEPLATSCDRCDGGDLPREGERRIA